MTSLLLPRHIEEQFLGQIVSRMLPKEWDWPEGISLTNAPTSDQRFSWARSWAIRVEPQTRFEPKRS